MSFTTDSRATLVHVDTRNVTLSLPEHLVQQFKILAAERGKSMSSLMAELMRSELGPRALTDVERAAAHERFMKLLNDVRIPGLGVKDWTRDELHER